MKWDVNLYNFLTWNSACLKRHSFWPIYFIIIFSLGLVKLPTKGAQKPIGRGKFPHLLKLWFHCNVADKKRLSPDMRKSICYRFLAKVSLSVIDFISNMSNIVIIFTKWDIFTTNSGNKLYLWRSSLLITNILDAGGNVRNVGLHDSKTLPVFTVWLNFYRSNLQSLSDSLIWTSLAYPVTSQ